MTKLNRRAFLRRAAGSVAGVHVVPPFPTAAVATTVHRVEVAGSARIAISLTMLGEQAAHRRNSLSGSLASLGGIRAVDGFVVEPDSEVILFGRPDGGTPLHIDDLAVALRNKYARASDPIYSNDPGCTIDPRPGEADPWALQEARLIGIPPCRMGARMLAYDYELKRIGGGIASHGTIPSSFDVSRTAITSCGNTSRSHSAKLVHRYWFVPAYPESPRYVADDACVLIDKPVGIRLLTEQEFLKNGERVGSTDAMPEARRWANQVTAAIARQQYAADMVGDFRFIEVAALMRHMSVAPALLSFLLMRHEIEPAPVPHFVGGVYRQEDGQIVCKSEVHETRTTRGTMYQLEQSISHYRLEYRGGVEAGVRVADRDFSADASGRIQSILGKLHQARPAPDAISWRFMA